MGSVLLVAGILLGLICIALVVIAGVRECRELDALIVEVEERNKELKAECRRQIKEFEAFLSEMPEDHATARMEMQSAIAKLREVVE